MDIFPTIINAAGIHPANTDSFDGINLWDTLLASQMIERDTLVIQNEQGHLATFDKNWKLIQGRNGQIELFDIKQDPYEKNNLSRAFPDIVESLKIKTKARYTMNN